jgi:hypothetical protein
MRNKIIINIFLLAATSLFFVRAAHAATPTYANNGASCSNTQANAKTVYNCQLPNTAGAGNAIVVFGQWGTAAATTTVSDNASDTYSQAACITGNQKVCAYYALNVSSSARTVTITLSAARNFFSAAAYEFYNIATSSALDGTCTANNTGTSVACDSPIATTTAQNDLILFWAAQDGASVSTTWTPGASPWVLRTADKWDATAMEYQVQAATSSITPSMTMSPTNHFDGIGFALKSATAGTAPSSTGIRTAYIQHNALPAGSNGCGASPCTKPVTLQFPCAGSLVLASWMGSGGYNIQSATSSPANTWSSTGAPVGNGSAGDNQIYYAANATCAATTSISFQAGTSTDGGTIVQLLDVVGAATSSPFDSTAGLQTCTGNQVASGTLTTCSITPSTVNGLVLTQVSISSNVITGVSPGNFLSTIPTPVAVPEFADQAKGWGINYNTNTSTETFLWTTSGGAVGLWASIAAAFKAPAAPAATSTRKIRVIGISR